MEKLAITGGTPLDGDITVSGADASNPTIVLRNVRKPDEVYEIMRKAWLAARKKYNLSFREEM